MHSEDMHGAFCQADRGLDGGWCLNGRHHIKIGYTAPLKKLTWNLQMSHFLRRNASINYKPSFEGKTYIYKLHQFWFGGCTYPKGYVAIIR